jgi:hypothetical protein
MAPPSLWSGNLRLSLVIIPLKLSPAITNEEAVSFRMIHEPSGQPVRYVKGVRDGDKFTEVPTKRSSKAMNTPRHRTAGHQTEDRVAIEAPRPDKKRSIRTKVC